MLVDWEGHDHTCGGRKEVELGRGLLPCSVLESRPELSPEEDGCINSGGGIQKVPTASTPWSGFCDVFGRGQESLCNLKITVGKIRR